MSVTGTGGEHAILSKLAFAGCKVSQPTHDVHGWDVQCLFERESGQGLGLPFPAPELTCFLQIKSSKTRRWSEPIKLSNWLKMVQNPIPWFVVRVHVDPVAEEVVGVYCAHIDQRWVERALEAVCSVDAGNEDHLNRVELNVEWSPADEVPAPFGRALMERIRRDVGDYRTYASRKIQWNEEAGGPHQRVSIVVSEEEAEDANRLRAEFAIGLVNQLPIRSWRHEVVRFGKPHLVAEHSKVIGHVSVDRLPSLGTSTAIFRAASAEAVTLVCETYSSHAMFPDLPEHLWRVRLVAPHVSFTLRPEEQDPKFSWEVQLPLDGSTGRLGDVYRAAELTRLFAEHGEEGLTLEVGFRALDPRPLAHVRCSSRLDDELRDHLLDVHHLMRVAVRAGLDDSSDVDLLDIADQRLVLMVMTAALDGGGRGMTVRFDSTASPEPGTACVGYSMARLQVGERVIAAAIAFVGAVRLDDDQRVLDVERVEAMEWRNVAVADWETTEQAASTQGLLLARGLAATLNLPLIEAS